MAKVRAVSLNGFLEAAQQVGLDGRQMFREMGLTPAMLDNPENRLPASTIINLVEKAAERSHCPEFGLLMFSRRTFASLGPITLLLEHLDTVRDVLAGLVHFRRLINDVLTIDVEEVADTALINVSLADRSKRQAVVISVAATYLALGGASGGRWAPDCVHFTHDLPTDLSLWQRTFRTSLDFKVVFAAFLARPPPSR